VIATLGVEEEYLLLDAAGLPVARSAAVLTTAGRAPRSGDAELQHELLEVQAEVATSVCTELGEVEEQLLDLRATLARAARVHDCRLAPIGAAPLHPNDDEVVVTDKPRYRDMLLQAPALVEEQFINGMHVHVGVPDRGAGVRVLAGLRAWLPVVLALSANSPFWRGRDSGFASFRAVHFARWPAEGPTPVFASAADYEARAEALLATGAVRDRAQLYWHARLSEHVPTVEIRVADVQLEPESAVVLAGVIRALVVTALASPPPAPADQVPVEVLRAATWAAARHGLDGDLVDPLSGVARPAKDVVAVLLDHVRRGLDDAGDRDRVETHVAQLLAGGNGATRQRSALRENGIEGLLELVTGSG
jgi:carboxylate-amine ligase